MSNNGKSKPKQKKIITRGKARQDYRRVVSERNKAVKLLAERDKLIEDIRVVMTKLAADMDRMKGGLEKIQEKSCEMNCGPMSDCTEDWEEIKELTIVALGVRALKEKRQAAIDAYDGMPLVEKSKELEEE